LASVAGEIQENDEMDCKQKRPPRQKVVVKIDGELVRVFGDNIDPIIIRVPVAHSVEAERQADEIVEMLLPLRFREICSADRLRAVGTTRPLFPSTLARSLATNELIGALNATTAPAQEVVAWML
jgi:hypothetical protein